MLGCEILFGRERAVAISETIEAATGEPCPCKQDKPCLLLPTQREPSDM